MLALPVGASDPAISGAADQAILEIKICLSQLVQAYMACVPVASVPSPERIKSDLSELTRKSVSNKRQPDDLGKFGFGLRFDGDFLYGSSPPDRSRAWYVIVTYIAPWCSSTWSLIHYEVVRPARDNSKQAVLLEQSEDVWSGGDDFRTLVVKPAEFELRFDGSSIDQDVQNRAVVRRFEIVGNHFRRLQPVALSPRDFVDEWIVSPWEQAAQWSAASSGEALQNARRAAWPSQIPGVVRVSIGSAVLQCAQRLSGNSV
jgi:hypothetical protein